MERVVAGPVRSEHGPVVDEVFVFVCGPLVGYIIGIVLIALGLL